MAKVISIHEYDLRPYVDPEDFEEAIQEAVRGYRAWWSIAS